LVLLDLTDKNIGLPVVEEDLLLRQYLAHLELAAGLVDLMLVVVTVEEVSP
jgi:hypothetical protein